LVKGGIQVVSISSSISRGGSNQLNVKKQDKEIQSLIKHKESLEEEISNVNNNKNMDQKLKMERINTLRESIQQIDMQISKVMMEQRNEKVNHQKPEEKSNEVKEDKKEETTESKLNSVVASSSIYKDLSKLAGARRKIEGDITTLQRSVYFDREIILKASPSADEGKDKMLENAENTVFKMKRGMIQELKEQSDAVGEKISELVENSSSNKTKNSPSLGTAPADNPKDDQDHNEGKPEKAEQIKLPAQTNVKIDIRI
jgi:phage protein D